MKTDTVQPQHGGALEDLVRECPGLWRGRSKTTAMDVMDSGFPELNAILPGGGWPRNSVIEVVVEEWGNGELQIFLPLMHELAGEGNWLSMVAPPYLPYAPGLEDAGLNPQSLVVIDREVAEEDRWWSAEKLLRHGDCPIVLMWPCSPRPESVRRLLQAASEGSSLGILFRRGKAVDTPVSLRVEVGYCARGTCVEVIKSRSSWQRGQTVIPSP